MALLKLREVKETSLQTNALTLTMSSENKNNPEFDIKVEPGICDQR